MKCIKATLTELKDALPYWLCLILERMQCCIGIRHQTYAAVAQISTARRADHELVVSIRRPTMVTALFSRAVIGQAC